MRELPILVTEAKNAVAQRTFWLMDVFLKAGNGYAAETLYFSSQAIPYNGNFYEPRLKTKPQVRHTLGASTDGGTSKIDNTDLAAGLKFLPKERFVEGSAVVIYFAWKLPDGSIYADKVFDGEINGAQLSMADGAVNLTLIGDLYKSNNVLGAFPLAQRCVAEFNVNGIRPIGEGLCDWQTIMGGNPLFCDKTQDGQDGAEAHNCQKMVGIPFFANVTVQIIASSGGTGSSGFPETYECFINESPVLLPNWAEMPLGEFVEGSPIMSFNEMTGELEPDEVEQVHIHPAEWRKIITLKFADRIVRGVTSEHPAFVEIGKFQAVGDLIHPKFIQALHGVTFENYDWQPNQILDISERTEFVEVRNLSVRKNKTFIINRLGWHNIKATYPINV